MGRALGLDVGTKTIGVAVSDPLGIAVRPVCTLRRKGVRQDVARLAPIAREQEVESLVVGLPLELDGEEGRSARLARQVGDALGEELGLAPIYLDERYSSVDADRVLVEADFSRKKRKKVIDQAAAILILRELARTRKLVPDLNESVQNAGTPRRVAGGAFKKAFLYVYWTFRLVVAPEKSCRRTGSPSGPLARPSFR